MDGNGRWARLRNRKRAFGHIKGAKKSLEIVRFCSEKNLPYLTLFALSTENTLRPKGELVALLQLIEDNLKHSRALLNELDIRFSCIGDLRFFPDSIQNELMSFEKETKTNKGMNLILALNYGGQQEIFQAVKLVLKQQKDKLICESDLNQEKWASFLSSSRFPPPDLILRTGGQMRLSNFYLWSAAYSELYFCPSLWPDFSKEELDKILQDFLSKKRKFGLVSENL